MNKDKILEIVPQSLSDIGVDPAQAGLYIASLGVFAQAHPSELIRETGRFAVAWGVGMIAGAKLEEIESRNQA